jgi:CHAT domain-containing protein/tetratricopeptide (TPR) repeat protein
MEKKSKKVEVDMFFETILAAQGEEARELLLTGLHGGLTEEFLKTLEERIVEAFTAINTSRIHRLLDIGLHAGDALKRDDVLYNAYLFKGFSLAGSEEDEALRWFRKALDKALTMMGDAEAYDINSLVGMAIRNIATIQHRQGLRQFNTGDNDGAIDLLTSAIQSFERLISQPGIEQSYKFLAYALEYSGRNEDALEYYRRAVEKFMAMGNNPEAATVLMYQAGCLRTMGRFGDSLLSLNQAADICDILEDKTKAAEVSVRIADIYFTVLGDYDKALEHLEKVVGSGCREQESTALMQRAGIYLDRGSYGLMLKNLESMITLLSPPTSDMEHCLLVDAYTQMAEAHFLLRDFVKAAVAEQEALNLARAIDYRAGLMRLYESMGNRSHNLGYYEEALKHYQEALEFAREPEDIKTKIRLLRGKGYVLLSLHCVEDALTSCSDAIGCCRRYHLKDEEIETMRAMGYCLSQTGRYDQALEQYRDAIGLCGSLDEHLLDVVACRKDMAGILADQGKTEEAFSHLLDARTLHRARGLQRDEVYDGMELGMLAHKAKDYAKARQFYAEAIMLCSGLAMTDEKVNCLHGQAFSFAAEEEYDQALVYLNSAWNLLDPSKDRFLVFTTQYALGIINKKKGVIEKAAEHYMVAWMYMDTLRKASITEEFRVQWMTDKKTLAEETIEVLLLLGRNEEAFYYVEKAKSRVLAELIGLSKLRKPVEISAEYSALEDDLLAQTRSIQTKMRVGRGEERDYISGANLSSVLAKLDALWGAMDTTYADSVEVKEYLSIRRGDAISADEARTIIGAIPGTTAIVEYFFHRERFYIFILRSDKQKITVVEVGQAESRIREIIKIGIETGQTGMSSAFRMWELNLAPALVDPLVSSLDGCDLIYFVPFGDIERLPLHAFKTAAGFRLIEKYDTAFIPSTSLLRCCLRGRRSESTDSLVLAFEGRAPDPILKQAYPEAQAVASILSNAEVCLGAEATIGNLIRKCKDKHVVHLTCHGEFNARDPMKSCLYLYDGVLTADEIFQKIELKTHLVTLAACQTGQASMGPGDETFGLIRAFLYAGVSAMLVGLWNLNDERSSLFLEKFYRNTKTMTVVRALAETQREVMNEPGYLEKFWAPFILVGNYR